MKCLHIKGRDHLEYLDISSVFLFYKTLLFYKTETLRKCLNILDGHVLLCEDTSQQIIALQGGVINKFDEYVVWYEDGTGVSTKQGGPGKTLLNNDTIAFYKIAQELCPEQKSRLKRSLKLFEYQIKNKRIPYLLKRLSSFSHVKFLAKSNLQNKRPNKPMPDLSLYAKITQKLND